MRIWLLNILPEQLILLLAPLSLIAIGIAVETKYTGRVTLFANAIALVAFFSSFETLPGWALWYTNLMTLLGIVGFVSYAIKQPLFEMYYHVGKIGSSVVTGIVIVGFSFA